MKFFKTFLNFFAIITLGITIVCGLNLITANDTYIVPKHILLQVAAAGAITALITAAVFYKEPKTTKQFWIVTAIHYVLLCGIMILIGLWFDWLSLDLKGILSMVISVALVYALTFILNYILAKKDADEINKALQRRRK